MNTITDIETNCQKLAGQRGKLRRLFEARQKAINAICAQHDEEIRKIQGECTASRDELLAALEASRDLFKKPKSRTFHGITVGFEKGRDTVTIPDEKVVVGRIQTMLPAAQGKTLLVTETTIIKAAFKKLARDVLQKLGCSVVSGADKAIVHANDDDIETLVQKSLGDSATTEVAS